MRADCHTPRYSCLCHVKIDDKPAVLASCGWGPRLLTSVFIASKLGHALRRAQKIYSRTPGFPTNWLEGLDDGTAVGFALDLQSVRYVDMTGKQHTVDPVDFDGAFIDPLGMIGALDCRIASHRSEALRRGSRE